MTLQPWQLGLNSKLSIGGSEGYVARHDAALTYIAREDGTVDVFTTDTVMNDAERVLSDSEKAVQSSEEQAKDQRISNLESQLEQLKNAQTQPPFELKNAQTQPPDSPAVTQGPAAVSVDPNVSPEPAQSSNPFELSPSTGPDSPASTVASPTESPTTVSAVPNEQANEQAPSTSPGQENAGEESNRQQTQ